MIQRLLVRTQYIGGVLFLCDINVNIDWGLLIMKWVIEGSNSIIELI